jgi:hypothetical protein
MMNPIDYTEIRDERVRGKICGLMSEMLDNPDEHGIYPTSKFLWEMEDFILAENQRLQKWVADLQSGMYINCVYCGHRYGPKEDTPVAMADVLKAHIEQCPEHPLSHAKAEIERLRGLCALAANYIDVAHSVLDAYREGHKEAIPKSDVDPGVPDPPDRGADPGEGAAVTAEEWLGIWLQVLGHADALSGEPDGGWRIYKLMRDLDPRRKEKGNAAI